MATRTPQLNPKSKQPERCVQYHTRNMWVRNLKRMRTLVALRPERFATIEMILNEALDKGLDMVFTEEKLPRVI